MRSMVSLGVGIAAAVVVSGILTGFHSQVVAQGSPHVGTWVLNLAKSKYTPGPPPKEQTGVVEAAGQGIKSTATGIDAAGKPTKVSYTANFDGKDYPVTGSADFDTVSFKSANPNTLEFSRKKGGKVVQTGTMVVSADGKTRTITATGTNAQGQKINNVVVYDRK